MERLHQTRAFDEYQKHPLTQPKVIIIKSNMHAIIISEEFLSKSEPNKMNTHKNVSLPFLTNLNDTQNLFSNATVTFDEKVSNIKYPEVRSEVESVASDPHHGPAGPHSWIFFSSKRRAFNHLPLFHWVVRVYIVVRLGFHTYGALVEGHNSRAGALFSSRRDVVCFDWKLYRYADRRYFLNASREHLEIMEKNREMTRNFKASRVMRRTRLDRFFVGFAHEGDERVFAFIRASFHETRHPY